MKVIKIVYYVAVLVLLSAWVFDFQGNLDRLENFVVNVYERVEQTRVKVDTAQELLRREIEATYEK